jgi:hypothetical protein
MKYDQHPCKEQPAVAGTPLSLVPRLDGATPERRVKPRLKKSGVEPPHSKNCAPSTLVVNFATQT